MGADVANCDHLVKVEKHPPARDGGAACVATGLPDATAGHILLALAQEGIEVLEVAEGELVKEYREERRRTACGSGSRERR